MYLNVFTILSLPLLALSKIDVRELKCLVCQATFDELGLKVNKLDPTIRTEIGGYRIDAEGNLKRKTVSQAESEVALSEVIEDVCEKMDDYVRATWKSNGTLTLLQMVLPDGTMNPHMSAVDFVQDDDLNKSLKYYCEEILEMHEDDIIKQFINDKNAVRDNVCIEETKYCDRKSDDNEKRSEEKEEL